MKEKKNDHGPAVENGQLRYTSATAMQKAGTCLRQWWFRYVKRLPDKPKGKGAIRGEEGHQRLEWYLRREQDCLDPLERMGVQRGFVPTPGPDLGVELPIDGTVFVSGVPLVGKIDLMNPRTLSQGYLELRDWKFKKSIEKYGVQEDDLVNPQHEAGQQMLAYAEWAGIQKKVACQEVELVHVTFQTEGRRDVDEKKKRVGLVEAHERWQSFSLPLIEKMAGAAKKENFLEVEAVDKTTPSICEKYGGCPYKETCLNKATRFALGFKKGKSKMPIQAPTGYVPTSLKPALVSVPQAPVTLSNDLPLQAKGAAQGKTYLVPNSAGVMTKAIFNVPYTTQAGVTYYSFQPEGGLPPILAAAETMIEPVSNIPSGGIVAVIPPDAPRSDPALAAKPAPGTVTTPIVPQNEAQTVAALKASIEQNAATPEEPKKRGRGRPSKAMVRYEDVENGAPVQVIAEVPAPAVVQNVARIEAPVVQAPMPQAQVPAQAPATGMLGVFLYRNCAPIGVATKTLADYVNSLDAEIQAQAKTEYLDLRVATDNVFGFGKYKTYFAKAALERPPEPGCYVHVAGDERSDAVFEALCAKALPGCVVLG